ncbi:hypothetical protein LTS18_004091 [Coniosporium uncinatum]|uniref:Uncharacterized protein n=1 Tax=Coniosporium uncinatum TaxID=93489 RepID=A0ACC3DT36_9PEZI|nr:hypothetical protein LTS18_004091 [Coniosporium uncinatum]
MAATMILDLPPELISSIVAYLSTDDVFAFRLANGQLERASFAHFGHRFFRKKGYMITSPSLDVLRQVALHAELRKYVQHVWFNPDCFTFVYMDSWQDNGSEVAIKRRIAYTGCTTDHRNLLSNAARSLQEVLVRVLKTLPNLETLGMRRSEDHSPWGWSKLRDVVGEDPRVLGPIPNGEARELSRPTSLFIAIINALAVSGTKLKRLYTDAIELDNIDPGFLTQEALVKACCSILYLETNITKGFLDKRRVLQDYILLSDPTSYGKGLVRLLSACPNLLEIGLQIFPDRKQSHMVAPNYHDPQSWRHSYPYLCLENLVANVHLPHLTRVKLEKLTTSPATLLALLNPSSHCLRSLKLRDIRLLPSSSVVEHENETLTEDPHRPWQPIFTFLLNGTPHLTYLLLNHLMHSHGGVSFVPNPPTLLPPSETDPTTGAPNPAYGELLAAGGGSSDHFFEKCSHIALEVQGDREEVREKVAELVEGHWYCRPMFSQAMDDGLWHTDTSDEEW